MKGLFNDRDQPPTDRPPVEVVRLLEGFGYRADAVRLWSAQRAYTTLNACRRERQIAMKRAALVAGEQEETPVGRGQPSLLERQLAADYIAQSGTNAADELCQTLSYTLHALTDAELTRLAGFLVRTLRGEADATV